MERKYRTYINERYFTNMKQMKNIKLFALVLFTTTQMHSQNETGKKKSEMKYSLPPLEEVGKGALLERQFIYSLDNKPSAEAHASTLVETPNGIMAAFFAGPHEGHPFVGIRVSTLKDNKWSWPVEVANGFENDSLRYPTWNPVLFIPKGGDLQLYYKQGPSPIEWWGMMKVSKDNGKTWSYGEKMGDDAAIGHIVGPVKNKPVQLKDGTILSPSSSEIMENGEPKWRIHLEISKDNGKSWEIVGPINDGIEFDAIQPSILELPDGKLMMLARTRQDVLVQSWSSDKGRTWSKLEASGLPNPNSGTDAVTLKDGRQLLIYNHKTKSNGERGRDILNLAISRDGKKWTPVMTIENEPSVHGYAYPAIIQSKDGLVHATYTYNRTGIKYIVVDPNKL